MHMHAATVTLKKKIHVNEEKQQENGARASARAKEREKRSMQRSWIATENHVQKRFYSGKRTHKHTHMLVIFPEAFSFMSQLVSMSVICDFN